MDCHFCQAPGARLNGNHWTGTEYVRVNICDADACQAAWTPRRPRRAPRPRQPVILDAGGWAMVPALNRAMAARPKADR
jgi:hypothetical protein